MSKNVRRRGFTLPEVLVTITIVAVLAAVVVPAVLNQVSKGDTASVAGDVDALRTAISNFTTDTRHYPKSIHDLVSRPLFSENDLFGVQYGQTAVNAWKGPYFPINQDTTAASLTTNGYVMSAFNLAIASAFDRPDTNGNFITLRFSGSGATAANVAVLDRLFDGGTGTVPTGANTTSCGSPSAGSIAGAIRWSEDPGTVPATDPCDITNLRWRLISAAQ
jgi:prepilin-type N-terminal cleavage/methylation domain-containing protein